MIPSLSKKWSKRYYTCGHQIFNIYIENILMQRILSIMMRYHDDDSEPHILLAPCSPGSLVSHRENEDQSNPISCLLALCSIC